MSPAEHAALDALLDHIYEHGTIAEGVMALAEKLCDAARSAGNAPADDLLSDRVAAAGVRQLLAGELTGAPLPGTLADSVNQWADNAAEDALWRGFR